MCLVNLQDGETQCFALERTLTDFSKISKKSAGNGRAKCSQ